MSQSKHEAIYGIVCKSCGEQSFPQAGIFTLDLSKIFDKAVDWIFKGTKNNIQRELANQYVTNYNKGLEKGFKGSVFDMAWESPDRKMKEHLQNNVYEFSHAKSFEQLQALTRALYDKEGNIVPYNEFKELAGRINNELGIRHLKTEYNTAISASKQASKWARYGKDKDIFPNLMFVTAGDSRVRPSHEALDGVVKPMDDPFWDRNAAPLGWGCRCDTRQATGGRKVTPDNQIIEPGDTPPLFGVNFARNGMVFPPGHPYFTNLPKELLTSARVDNPFLYDRIHKGKQGGYVYNSAMSEAKQHELTMASLLADGGHKVIYLPDIKVDSDLQMELRKIALPEAFATKKINIDALVDGELFEFKSSGGARSSVLSQLEKGFKKWGNVVLHTTNGMTKRDIMDIIIERQSNKSKAKLKIDQLWWIDKDGNIVNLIKKGKSK